MNLQNALTDKSISFSSRDNSFRGPAKMSYLRKNILIRINLMSMFTIYFTMLKNLLQVKIKLFTRQFGIP